MNSRTARRVGRLLLIALALVSLGRPALAWAQDDVQKKVLVLYSTGRDAAVTLVGERQLPRVLEGGLVRHLDYYSEFLDAGRFADPQYEAGVRDFLRLKYGSLRFDIVIAVLDGAISFLHTYRDELFPETPIVYFAHSPIETRIPNSTGAWGQLDFTQTLMLATALQPDVRQVFVVSGAATRDRTLERTARGQFRQFEPRLTFTYLSGLPTSALERRLASLPADSIVYYLLVYQDGAGEVFQPLEYLDHIATRANRPIYSWTDSTIGRNVVGGSMQRLDAQIESVARLALRVLAGEPADSIQPLTLTLNENQVDWRQIRRWGISEARIPAGTVIKFRDATIWERYTAYIIGASAVLLAQTALIIGLLVQAARRRRAEDQVRRSEAELRKSSERVRDLGGRLLNAQEAERARIARELHDDVGQKMALLMIDLQLLSGFGPIIDPDAERLMRESLERAGGIVRSVHDLSHRLHPSKLRLIGLMAALHGLQREFADAGLAVTFSHGEVAPRLSPDVALCLFRVVQEALKNVLKHSGARAVSMELRERPTGLLLTIADDGVGFDVDATWDKGLGLISMAERLESIEGTITIHSRPGEGTRLEITAPVLTDDPAETVAV
jgi:signal transduction histidine kinase